MKIINCRIEHSFRAFALYEITRFFANIHEDWIEVVFSTTDRQSDEILYVKYEDFVFDKSKEIAKKQASYLVKIILYKLYNTDHYDFNDIDKDVKQAIKDYNKDNGIK